MDGLRDRGSGYSEHFGALTVDAQMHAGRIFLDRGVDCDNVIGLRKSLDDPLRELLTTGFVRTIDLRHQRTHDRRTRWNFHHFDPGAVALGNLLDLRTQPLRDRVALFTAMLFVDQRDLQVAQLRLGAQIILAHQPIECDGACRAGVALQIADFRLAGEELTEIVQGRGGIFQRCARGHVDDDLELALVVKGQHFENHPLHHRQTDREHERRQNACEQQPPLARAGQQGIQDT